MVPSGRSNNPEDNDENIQMFVSSAAMETEIIIKTKNGETFCKKMEIEKEYSEEAKRKHEQIIRKLLEEFDLEKTKDKYRGGNKLEYKLEANGLQNFKFREELMRLMGSDVVKLHDKKWIEEFQTRVYEEYHKHLDVKEKLLADAEDNRIRKLKLEGVLPMSDDDDNTDKKYYHKRQKHSTNTKKHKKQSPSQARHSAPANCNHQIYRSTPSENTESQVEIYDSSPRDKDLTENNTTSNGVDQNTNDIDDRGSSTPKRFNNKKIPQEMGALFEEESVNGLYSVAARLVPKSR